jgi:hypothetical protein
MVAVMTAGPGCIISGKDFRLQNPPPRPESYDPTPRSPAGPADDEAENVHHWDSLPLGYRGYGGVDIHVQSVYITKFPGSDFDDHFGLRFSLEVGRRQGVGLTGEHVKLGEARLTRPGLPECSSGPKSKSETWTAGATGEPDKIVVAFSRPAAVAAGTFDGLVALDVQVFPDDKREPTLCVRIPITNGGRDSWVQRPFLLAGEQRLMFMHSAAPGLQSRAMVLGVGTERQPGAARGERLGQRALV